MKSSGCYMLKIMLVFSFSFGHTSAQNTLCLWPSTATVLQWIPLAALPLAIPPLTHGYLWCTGFDADHDKMHVNVKNGLLGWWLGDYFNHSLITVSLSILYYVVHYTHTLGLFVNCFESFFYFYFLVVHINLCFNFF